MVFTPFKEECVVHNVNNVPYEEIWCNYPTLKPIYTKAEQDFGEKQLMKVHDWMIGRWYVPVAAVILYGILICWGTAIMKDRKPLKWRKTLALWNLFLSIFSWCGTIRLVPHVIHNYIYYSLRDNMCNDPESMVGSGSTGVWIQFFVLSKFPELVDTFFIIIHKKPLLFLHYYHHITVLLYCWFSYTNHAPAAVTFATINCAVHAIMYFYYFLMAIRMKPKWMKAIFITVAQISQMVVGVIVTGLTFYYYMTDENSEEDPCWIKKENNIAAFLMYGSYLLLFLQFFFARYMKDKKTEAALKKMKKG